MKDTLDLYHKELHNTVPLTKQQLKTLALVRNVCRKKGYKKLEEKAIGHLVKHNLRLVYHIAKNFNPENFTRLDLIAQGTIGLFNAAKYWDCKQSFIPYAAKCIRNEIIRFIYTNRSLIHYTWWSHYNSDAVENQIRVYSLDIADAEYIESKTIENQEDIVYKQEQSKLLSQILKELPERERKILKLKFGIGISKTYTLQEIANKYNISRQAVGQQIERVLKKIKEKHEHVLS